MPTGGAKNDKGWQVQSASLFYYGRYYLPPELAFWVAPITFIIAPTRRFF
jgi:hypothetical protein